MSQVSVYLSFHILAFLKKFLNSYASLTWPDLSSMEGIIAFSISACTEDRVLLVGFLVQVLMLKVMSPSAEERCGQAKL